MCTLSDAELLADPVEQRKRFTPHERLLWVRAIIERVLDLPNFPCIGMRGSQQILDSQ